MTKEGYAKLTLILSIIAAGLAVSAALIKYVRGGEVDLALMAAAVFLLAFGFGAKSRIGRREWISNRKPYASTQSPNNGAWATANCVAVNGARRIAYRW